MTVSRAHAEAGFVRRLVHELRTPLASIRLLAESLADDPAANLGPRQSERAHKIHRVATDLGELLAAVSELAAIEDGRVPVELETIAVRELARELEADSRPLAAARRLALEVVAEDPPPTVVSDRPLLKKLLALLLDHAVSRPEAGELSVLIDGKVDPRDRSRVLTIAVRDRGRAIPEEHREVFFEPLGRRIGPGEQGGRGRLALATAKALAELLGGGLELAAGTDSGCTLVLTLAADPGIG